MKYLKMNKKFLYSVILIIFFIQIVLIGHRNSFSFSILKNFYKENIGLEEGIKNKEIHDIIKIIKKNNLKDFKLSDKLLKSVKIKHRVIEGAYPAIHVKKSKTFITKIPKSMCEIKERNRNIYLIICE